MNRTEYNCHRRLAYNLRVQLKALNEIATLADSSTVAMIGADLDVRMRVQHAINVINLRIRPKGRDVMRLEYLRRKLKLAFELRARAGRNRDATAFGIYHRMRETINEEIRRENRK